MPSPFLLQAYEGVLPGSADRIMDRLERQSIHRQQLETQRLEADIAREKRGQIFAFLISLAALGFSFALIYMGKNIPGTLLFISTFASLVGVFVFAKVRQSKDLAEKRQDLRAILRSSQSEMAEEPAEG